MVFITSEDERYKVGYCRDCGIRFVHEKHPSYRKLHDVNNMFFPEESNSIKRKSLRRILKR